MESVRQLSEAIDFAIDVTEPRDVRLRRFQTLIEVFLGVWPADDQSEDAAIVTAVTAIVRDADAAFQRSGGSSRHWVRDCFLPTLNTAGWCVKRAAAEQPEPLPEPPQEPQP